MFTIFNFRLFEKATLKKSKRDIHVPTILKYNDILKSDLINK